MKKRFDTDLKKINPDLLVNKNIHNKTESFFIRLGIVFNSLKSLIIFEKLLLEEFDRPEKNEETSHSGEHSGIWVYIQTSIASTIHEFFELLHKNKKLLEDDEFKSILNKIPKRDRMIWDKFILTSEGKFEKVSNMLEAISDTRNYVGFHFDHNGSEVWNAYVSRFFREDKSEKNKYAYYAIDDKDPLKTRFYFCDAVVEENLYLNAGKQKNHMLKDNKEWEDYFIKIKDTVDAIFTVIPSLMKKHIETKRNKPR